MDAQQPQPDRPPTQSVPALHGPLPSGLADQHAADLEQALAVLYQAAVAGAAATNEDDLITRITAIIGQGLFTHNFGALLLDESSGNLHMHASYQGLDPAARATIIPLGQGVTGGVALSGAPRRVDDTRLEPAYIDLGFGMRSELCVPLRSGERVLGVLNAESRSVAAYSPADERLLVTVAGQMATAIDRLRAEAAQRQASQRVTESRAVLYRASQEITGSLDLEHVYAATHRAVTELMPCEAFIIALAEEDHEHIHLVYAVDQGVRVDLGRRRMGDGLSGHIIATGQAVRVDHADELPPIAAYHYGGAEVVQAILAVPLRLGSNVFGMMSAQCYREAVYRREDLQTLTLLANQAAVAIEQARLFAAEREQRHLAEVLRETGALLSASLETDAVLDQLLEQVARVVPYDTATIMLREGELYRVARLRGYTPEQTAQLHEATFDARTTANLRTVIETGAPLIIADAHQFPGWVPLGASRHIRAWLGVPLIARDEIIAIFSLDKTEPAFFQPRHARYLATLAGQAALAVKNAQLYESERRRVAALTALHEMSLDVSQELDLTVLLRLIVSRAMRLLDATAAGLYLTRDDERVECVFSLGYDLDFAGLLLEHGQGMAGQVVETGQTLVVPDYKTWPHRSSAYDAAPVRAVIGAPIRWRGQVLGALSISADVPDLFGPRDVELIDLFADQAAVAVINARLYAEARGTADELGQLYAAAQEMAAVREPRLVLEVLARHLAQALRVSSAYVLGADPALETSTVLAEYWSAEATSAERVSSLGETYRLSEYPLALQALRSRASLVVHVDDPDLSPAERADLRRFDGQSTLYIPIIAHGEVLGEVSLWESRQRREFTPAEQQLAETLVRQAADQLENTRLIAALEDEKRRLELLYRLSQNLTASLDLGAVVQRALESVLEVLAARRAEMYLPEPGAPALRLSAAAGAGRPEWQQSPVAASLAAQAARERRIVRFAAPAADAPMPAALAVPLLIGELLVGVCVLLSDRPGVFADHSEPVLRALTGPMALALQNAQLFEAEARRAHHLEALNEISRAAVSALDFKTLQQTLADRLGEMLRADACFLTRWDAARQVPIPMAAWGDQREVYPTLHPQPGEPTLTELVLRTGEPQVIEDVPGSTLVSASIKQLSWMKSMLVLPMIAGDRKLGAVLVGFVQSHTFTPHEIARAEQATRQIALAIAKAQLFDETRRHADEVMAASEALRALNALPDVTQAFPAIAAGLRGITGCERLAMLGFSGPEHEVMLLAADPMLPGFAAGMRLPLTTTSSAEQVLAGRLYLVPDLPASSPFALDQALITAGYRSSATLPLRAGEQIVGSLSMQWRRPNGYQELDFSVVAQIAEAVALALEKNRLFNETRRRADELAALVEVSAALRLARNAAEMLPIFLHKACAVTGGDNSAIFLVEPSTGDLVLRGNHPPEAQLAGMRYRLGEGITGQVALTGEMHMTTDVHADPETQLAHPGAQAYLHETRSVLAVPLRTHDGVIGVMNVGSNRSRPFTATEIHLLTAIAEVAGNALHRANLLETLEERVSSRTRELARANERLKELDRLKDQFISNVSHELRTPLTNIKLHLGLLEKRGAEVLPRYLPTLARETERLRRLIEDLLDLSRLQAQIAVPRRTQQGMDGLIAEVVTMHITRAETRGLTLEHVPLPTSPILNVDRAQIIQVFDNLLGNAVSYTPSGGKVRVYSRVVHHGGRAGLEVSFHNTESVIPVADLPHLFERFYRGRTGLDSGEAGTGLGLAICKDIVEHHGGDIGVASNAAEGTTFTVWLPQGDANEGG
ncbi:MAG: GAF domain-containing protein [Anaerolineales bacterium]|nr:GAF domain-containing protein [Anaerolineales bacterium]